MNAHTDLHLRRLDAARQGMTKAKEAFMHEMHPEMWKEYKQRLALVRGAVRAEMAHVETALSVAQG